MSAYIVHHGVCTTLMQVGLLQVPVLACLCMLNGCTVVHTTGGLAKQVQSSGLLCFREIKPSVRERVIHSRR